MAAYIIHSLQKILLDIEESMESLTQDELQTFGDQWSLIISYSEMPNPDINILIERIKIAVSTCLTLVNEGFLMILEPEVTRFGQSGPFKPKPKLQGVPSVHNEIIRVGDKIRALLK